MPYVFHTKTIQSILDPVAQQVAQLIMLHEEAQEGRIVADLLPPVSAVSAAVQNLITIGKQTSENSKDELLKKDMPPAIMAIENATRLLSESAEGLRQETQSPEDKKKLLDGSRGILQGVSQLLLVFDQSEVRKMVKMCEGIIEYIKVSEMVESIEDVITFTENLAPNLTSMVKLVDTRREELTNASHSAILEDELNQVRKGLPLLLSALKTLVGLKKTKSEGILDAQENRDFIVGSLTESIIEIIRVLQLTSPTEEPGALVSTGGGLHTGGFPPGSIGAKIHQAKELLQESGKNKETDEAGILSVTSCTTEARKIAESFSPNRKFEIDKLCDEIDAMAAELAQLQANGQGSTATAKAIAEAINQKLITLEKALKYETTNEIVNVFKDPLGPLNQLSEAAKASIDTPNRKEIFDKRVSTFEVHSKKMGDAAIDLAKAGGVMDKKTVDDIIRTSEKVKKMGPQVVHAANILFNNPDNEEAKAHYETLSEDYREEVAKLQKLVDSAVDAVEFVSASEAQLKSDLEEAKAYIRSGKDPQKSFELVASATRIAKRVTALTDAEIDNSDDPQLKRDLTIAKDTLQQSIAPVVTSARAAILQPKNEVAVAQFSQKADKLVKDVHEINSILDAHYNPPPPPPPPPEEPVPTRPPLPLEVDEMEEEAPLQQSNPIGFAAHQLHQEAKQWEDKDNDMVAAAKRMAKLMMQMSKFARGEEGEVTSKKDFIKTARSIAKESEEVVKIARQVADACTDRRMATTLRQSLEAIPTIATQLKIIAAVKASRQGGEDPEADKEATEMLTDNAQNLMKAVSDVLYATEAASIRVPPASREAISGLTWVKRSPREKTSLIS